MYEDLSGYEDEEGVVASPATLKQKVTKRSRAIKNKRTICPLSSGKQVSTSAFVVHGIPTMRPMSEPIQDVKKTGLSGVVGAMWLLGEYRRVGKLTSSLVIFLDPKARSRSMKQVAGSSCEGESCLWMHTILTGANIQDGGNLGVDRCLSHTVE
ncbi:hypothetical protein EV426DRAFT_609501 [Tirmania nivea]|nr:hypothetical protein EV426DRAFT_609501 [Tirmania nivea]